MNEIAKGKKKNVKLKQWAENGAAQKMKAG